MKTNPNKISIAICDDQKPIVEQLKQHIIKIAAEARLKGMELHCYTSINSLLESISGYNIIFLDLDMPEMDGIEAGYQINRLNPECKIIIATSRIDRYKEAFHVNAVRFVTKPFDEDEIKEALLSSISYVPGVDEIDAFRNRISCSLRQRDIKYIRAFNGYVEISAGSNMYRKDVSLNQLEQELDPNIFCRVHRSYIIGLRHITSKTANEVLIDNKTIPISKRKQSEFKKKYMEFDLNYR